MQTVSLGRANPGNHGGVVTGRGPGGKLNDINRERSRFISANNFPKPDDDYGVWCPGGWKEG